MSAALLAGLLADVGPSPSPTTPPLESWEVTPGLTGFLATFAVAVAAVLLFFSLSRHMRKANAYARAHGIEVPERRSIGFRAAGDDRGTSASSPDAAGTPVSPSDASPDGGAPDGPGRHPA
ncbi:hypothetical protein BCE75_10675 [Isoptericola sp. CG 20/1183]|uniref:Uncharacterized protein n=1 Tax=Isoptericola halotolerans TaxID=300560 RepID=A0ABX5EDN5_9MICO|nr:MULTISPECIES: hypothetical protein [Isoptericola]MCK0117841.1 hypothetical protein [Isoptericola sp. S6320L]PRZ06484.1 hypothetical protein BCL65_106159 [Isoptericola halotolerans]PRZ06710.1 hypothetical protein BCE75_10675 [Isoptericola sp. CG 20/1183]